MNSLRVSSEIQVEKSRTMYQELHSKNSHSFLIYLLNFVSVYGDTVFPILAGSF
jgi:hypothetical protein